MIHNNDDTTLCEKNDSLKDYSNKMIGVNFHLVCDLTASLVARSLLLKLSIYKHIKSSKCYLLGQDSLQISGVIPFVELQNDAETTVKQ